MIKKIINFIIDKKYATIWTVCYIAFIWAILLFLFKFDIFSVSQWKILLHAQLRGFPGFVFGILILAAIPLYVATTAIIIRNNKPLFTIPLPEFLKPVPEEKPEPAPAVTEDSTKKEEEPITSQSIEEELASRHIPTELRTAFIRVKNNMSFNSIKSNFDLTNVTENKNAESEPENTINQDEPDIMPLPEDFNFDSATQTENEDFLPNFTPVFQDVNFDTDETDTNPASNKTDTIEETKRYLSQDGSAVKEEEDILINDKYAVGIHEDDDFWIADNENWFAAGKQKASPADKAKEKAEKYKVQAVLYLKSTNIMDLDNRIEEWTKEGIKVIKTLSELK